VRRLRRIQGKNEHPQSSLEEEAEEILINV
jgi:hypothetical protein